MLDLQKRTRLARPSLLRRLPALRASLGFGAPSWATPLATFFGPEELALGDSPAHVRARLGESAGELFAAVDASAVQHERLARTLDRAAPELYALMEQEREVRDVVRGALFAEEVDHAGLERAQFELSSLASRGSELVVELLFEVTRVLTPAQRAQLAAPWL